MPELGHYLAGNKNRRRKRAAADGASVRDIVGGEPVEFAEAFQLPLATVRDWRFQPMDQPATLTRTFTFRP